MKNSLPLTLRPEKRRFTRVVFSRTVKLVVDEVVVGEYIARNLSMGGLFVECEGLALAVNTKCLIELREQGLHSSLILRICAKIIRVEDHGVAVEFTDMEDDSFMFLQTMVLYASDDPIGVAEDFLEQFSLVAQADKVDTANG